VTIQQPVLDRQRVRRQLAVIQRRRKMSVHFVVPNLVVTKPWRVGPATISPPGRVLDRAEADFAAGRLGELTVKDYRQHLGDRQWSTIRVPGTYSLSTSDASAVDDGREIARDVIAVLRLFQRVQAPGAETDWQTFGLAMDMGSVMEPRWFTDPRGRHRGMGLQSHGVGPSWSFRSADIAAFRADPRFQFLEAALVAGDNNPPDSWQARALASIRTWGLATLMQRPATRIVLLATALEGLLGNKYVPGDPATGGHVVARRAAYIWCGYNTRPAIKPHRPDGRPACPFLTTTTDPRRDPALYPSRGRWACSWYGDIRTLYDDRNAAVHGADQRWDLKSARVHGWNASEVILATLGWLTETGSTAISDVDHAIRALPAETEAV
jgi:hypothetical protein